MVAPSLSKYDQGKPQGFTHGPGLERATPWRVRRIAVRNLGDMTEASLIEMSKQWVQETDTRFAFRLRRVAPHAHPGLDKGPEKPRPDRALVVGSIPFTNSAFVSWSVSRLARCQRA